jgi:uridylate kinase
MNAGAAAPVDLLAAKVIQRSGLRTIVLDGTDPERIGRAVETGEHEGTDVLPANGGADPQEWAGSGNE